MGLTRDLDADYLEALGRRVIYPVVLIFLDWPDDPMHAHLNRGTIRWRGRDWLGAGRFGDIQIPEESFGMVAARAVVSMSGVPPELFERLSVPIRRRDAAIYSGLTTTPGGNTLIGTPTPMFRGTMDARRYTTQVEGGPLVHAVHVELSSGPGARSQASRYHSDEDQRAQHPWDTAGRLLLRLEERVRTEPFPAA